MKPQFTIPYAVRITVEMKSRLKKAAKNLNVASLIREDIDKVLKAKGY